MRHTDEDILKAVHWADESATRMVKIEISHGTGYIFAYDGLGHIGKSIKPGEEIDLIAEQKRRDDAEWERLNKLRGGRAA